MALETTQIPDILSGKEEIGAFIPPITFGYLYMFHDFTPFLAISVYLTASATQEFMSQRREDIPSENSVGGSMLFRGPLLLGFPSGLIFLIFHLFGYPSQLGLSLTSLNISVGWIRTEEILSISLFLINTSYLFGMLYHLAVGET